MGSYFELIRQIRALRLPCVEKAVLMMLTTYASAEGAHAFPSVPTLAGDCGVSKRAVQKALRRLLAKGYLEVEVARRHRPTSYRVVATARPRGERGSPLSTHSTQAPAAQGVNVETRGVNVEPSKGERGDPLGVNVVHPICTKNYQENSQEQKASRSRASVPLEVPNANGRSAACGHQAPTLAQVQKIVHCILDDPAQAPDSFSDLEEAVKCACAQAGFLYDSDLIRRGINTTRAMRGNTGKPWEPLKITQARPSKQLRKTSL